MMKKWLNYLPAQLEATSFLPPHLCWLQIPEVKVFTHMPTMLEHVLRRHSSSPEGLADRCLFTYQIEPH